MRKIYINLFIGSREDYKKNQLIYDDGYVIHACKEPYHRNLLG